MPRLPDILAGAGPAAAPTPRSQPADFGAGAGLASAGQALEQVSEISLQIAETAESSKARRLLAQTTERLQEFQFELESDPDFTTHDERFRNESDRLRREAESQINIPRIREEFALRFDTSTARLGLAVREGARERANDQTRADLRADLQSRANVAGRADDELARAEQRALAFESIEASLASGAISAVDAEKLREGFDSELAATWLVEGLRVDPEGTLSQLRARKGPADLFDEKERQEAITAAEQALKRLEAAQRAREREARTLEKEAARKQREATARELIAAKKQGTLTTDMVVERQAVLSPSQFEKFLEAASVAGPLDFEPEYANEIRRLAVEDPSALAKLEVDPVRAGDQYDRLLSLQDQALKNGRLDSPTRSLLKRVQDRAELLDLNDEEADEFDRRVAEEIEEFRARNNGKSPDRAQQDAIIDGLAITGDPRAGFDLFGFSPNLGRIEGEGEPIAEVPGELVEAIVDDLEDRGERVTPESLQARFSEIARQFREAGAEPTPDRILRALQRAREQR